MNNNLGKYFSFFFHIFHSFSFDYYFQNIHFGSVWVNNEKREKKIQSKKEKTNKTLNERNEKPINKASSEKRIEQAE